MSTGITGGYGGYNNSLYSIDPNVAMAYDKTMKILESNAAPINMTGMSTQGNQYTMNTYYPTQSQQSFQAKQPYGVSTQGNVYPMNTGYAAKPQPVKKDKSNDGKFSILEAGKNFLKGAFKFVTNIVKNPKTLLLAAGAAVLTAVCPPVGAALIAAGAVGGAFTLGKGVVKAVGSAAKGDWDACEKSFEDIGEGTSTLVMTAVGARSMAKARLGEGAKFTKFSDLKAKNFSGKKLFIEGSKAWVKESYGAIKSEGFSKDSYTGLWRFGKTNIKAAGKTFKGWRDVRQAASNADDALAKPKFKVISEFKNNRQKVFQNDYWNAEQNLVDNYGAVKEAKEMPGRFNWLKKRKFNKLTKQMEKIKAGTDPNVKPEMITNYQTRIDTEKQYVEMSDRMLTNFPNSINKLRNAKIKDKTISEIMGNVKNSANTAPGGSFIMKVTEAGDNAQTQIPPEYAYMMDQQGMMNYPA